MGRRGYKPKYNHDLIRWLYLYKGYDMRSTALLVGCSHSGVKYVIGEQRRIAIPWTHEDQIAYDKGRYPVQCEKIKARASLWWKNKRELIDSILGVACIFCGEEQRILHTHKKDGEPHESFTRMKTEKMLRVLRNNEYVRLCFVCHRGVHWLMKFGYSWDDIIGLHLIIEESP